MPKPPAIHPGEFFEDCGYRPCVCLFSNEEMVWGLSVVDGDYAACAYSGCAPKKLTFKQFLEYVMYGPPKTRCDTSKWDKKNRWWEKEDWQEWWESRKELSK